MEDTIKINTEISSRERGVIKTEIQIDNSTNYKDMWIEQSSDFQKKTDRVCIQIDEESKKLKINLIELDKSQIDLLKEFINQI